MIGAKYIYEKILSLLSLNNSEYFSPLEVETAVNTASVALYNKCLGNNDQRRSVLGLNQISDARLKPFKVSSPPLNPVGDRVNFPTKLHHVRAVHHGVGKNSRPAIYLDDNRAAFIRKDPNASLDSEVYYRDENNYLLLITDMEVDTVVVDYLKLPEKFKLVYTIVNRQVVINDSASTPLEWNEAEEDDIVSRALGQLGFKMKDGVVIQVTERNKAEE